MALAVDTRTGRIIEVSPQELRAAERALADAVQEAAAVNGCCSFVFGEEDEIIGFDPATGEEVDLSDEDFPLDDLDIEFGAEEGGGNAGKVFASLLPAVMPLASTAIPAVSNAINNIMDNRLARLASRGGPKGKRAAAKLKARMARRQMAAPPPSAVAPAFAPQTAPTMSAMTPPSAAAPAAPRPNAQSRCLARPVFPACCGR